VSQEELDDYREFIQENIEYDRLVRDYPCDVPQLDEMVELMVEAVCSKKETLRVAGNDFPPGGGEVPVAEAGPGAYLLHIRLSPGEHHPGAEHEAVSLDNAVQRAGHHRELLRLKSQP